MENEIYIGSKAEAVKDLSSIGFDCGFYQNAIGNYSLIPYGDLYLASFRVFGYWITTDRQEYVYTPNMVLDRPDEHIFCILDRDLNLVKRLKVARNTYYKPDEFKGHKTYLEDGRMCVWGGQICFLTATFYTNNNHYDKMGLEMQHLVVDGDEIRARHCWSSCEAGILGRHKNWMSIPDKPLQYVSATYAGGAQIIDLWTGEFVERGDCGTELYRGNTPLLKDGMRGCYRTITHRLVSDHLGRKRYVNHIVEYNADMTVRRISRPFKLCESNIEFVTTFLDIGDGKYLVGVTEMDDTPLAMVFDHAVLDGLFYAEK